MQLRDKPYWWTKDHEGEYQIIDWSESGWVVFEVFWWIFYIIVIVPIRLLIDLIRGRRDR